MLENAIARTLHRSCLPALATVLGVSGCVGAPAIAPGMRDVELVAQGGRQELPGGFRVLRDPEGTLSIADVATAEAGREWRRSDRAQVNLGVTADVYWVHLRLKNSSQEASERLLELPGTVDFIDLYTRDPAGAGGELRRTAGGKKVPFSRRPLDETRLVFRLAWGPGETRDVYLRMWGRDTLSLYPVLWTANAFRADVARSDLIWAVYFGGLSAIAIFNLFIWTTLRDRAYLYYFLCQVLVMLALGALDNRTYHLFWPEWPEWASRSAMVFSTSALFVGMAFMRAFVGVQFLPASVDRLIKALMAAALAVSACALLTDHYVIEAVVPVLLLVNCSAAFVTGIVASVRGSPNGPIFVAAWSILLISVTLSCAAYLGVSTWTPFLVEVPRLGSALEAILLSLGLARRIKLANREKDEAQRRLVTQERAHAQTLEQRVAERTMELQEALRQLETANDRMVEQARLAALGHLVSGVAHEVGNPLNFVLGGVTELDRRLRILEQKGDGDASFAQALGEARRAATLIENGSRRIHALLETLRSYLGVHGGLRESVKIAVVLESTLALIEPMAERQQVRVHRRFEADRFVQAGRGQLDQVFLNLLLNSCQAMPQGGDIEVTVVQAANGRIEVRIADTGPGVPPEHRDAIFDPFFTTRLGKGTGLGLSLSRRIVTATGGDLRLVDAPHGAAFVVSLPCDDPTA